MPEKIVYYDWHSNIGAEWQNPTNVYANDNSATDSNNDTDTATFNVDWDGAAPPPTGHWSELGEYVKSQLGIKLDDTGQSGDDDELDFWEFLGAASAIVNSFTTKADADYTAKKWYWYDSTLIIPPASWADVLDYHPLFQADRVGGEDAFTWSVYVVAQKVFYKQRAIKENKVKKDYVKACLFDGVT